MNQLTAFLDTLADMQDVLGGDRYVVLAREITKHGKRLQEIN